MLHAMPLALTAAALHSGRLELGAYIDEVCDRIDALEPSINALLPEPERRSRLLRDAALLVDRYPEPANRPPLYGVLVGVKDIFYVDGFPTRAGSALPAELFAGSEAACVRALRAAGVLILGKTVTAEFAYLEPGPTRNPHNPAHTPGGSSSGSAAAVAAGFCPLAVGTQTVGSVIRPAAFCGIVGFKPTYDRIATAGLIFSAPSLDTVGLFTQDVAGMQLAAPVVCRDWRTVAGAGLPVLGVPEGPYLSQASPDGLRSFEEQLGRLQAAGVEVRRVPVLPDIAAIAARHLRRVAGEMARVHAEWHARHAPRYRPRTAEVIREGQAVSEAELAAVRADSAKLRATLEAQMDAAGIDLWVSPAAPGAAPHGLASTGNSAMNLPWTQAGLPALTLPMGRAQNGLPLGLQMAGRAMEDEWLVAWAVALDELLASA